mgnify:CR=1 FL=1
MSTTRSAGARPKVIKSDEAWRAELTPEQYYVMRQAGTERPGTGPYLHETRAGTYVCVGCRTPLFRSEAKFESHCGWPSFYATADDTAIEEVTDLSHGMVRTEIRCATCDAHLGHVFPDGPPPTGLRYCLNGTALDLVLDARS